MAGMISARNSPVHLFCDSLCTKFPQIVFNHSKGGPSKLSFSLSRSSSYKPLTIITFAMQPQSTKSAANFDNTLPSREVLEIWQNADAVCFDVDSTVCLDEGIDELADFCGAGKAVAEWTNKAMSGSVPFEEALAARLSLFSPSLSQVRDFLDKRPPKISPGIAELINKLKAINIDVYLISGGFRQMINPVALQLGIPLENIFANQLLFGSSGEFLGFDKTEFTSRSGGKAKAVEHIRKVHEYKTLVMIGDGATDLEVMGVGAPQPEARPFGANSVGELVLNSLNPYTMGVGVPSLPLHENQVELIYLFVMEGFSCEQQLQLKLIGLFSIFKNS